MHGITFTSARFGIVALASILLSMSAAAQEAGRRDGPEARISLNTGIELTAKQFRAVRAINERTASEVRRIEAKARRAETGPRLDSAAVDAILVTRAREIYHTVLTPAQREQWQANARAMVAKGNRKAKAFENP